MGLSNLLRSGIFACVDGWSLYLFIFEWGWCFLQPTCLLIGEGIGDIVSQVD